MNKPILYSVIALSLIVLLEIPRARDLIVIAASLYMLTGGILWLATQRLPSRFILNLVILWLGPLALIMLLNVLLNLLQDPNAYHAALSLLVIILIGGIIGYRLFRGKKTKLF